MSTALCYKVGEDIYVPGIMELPAHLGHVCGIFGRYSYIRVIIYIRSTHIFELNENLKLRNRKKQKCH